MSKLMDKILGEIKNPYAAVYADSEIVDKNFNDFSPTPVKMLNVALSGRWDGGITPGITIFAGESKMGKTYIGLVCVKAYMDKYPDSICIFMDTELGAGKEYFRGLGIDSERILHLPVENIEEAKFQLVKILNTLDKNEKAIIFFDSIGNVASKKEVEDAEEGKSVADMSRAKALKSFFRVCTMKLILRGIPFIGIAHTYKTQDFFPKDIVGGGTGSVYTSNSTFILSKSKETENSNSNIVGFNFNLKVYKSRFVKEGKVFTLNSNFIDGIDPYSGLFEWCLENGYIVSPSRGFYSKHPKYGDEKKYRKSEFEHNPEIWKDFENDEEFIRDYENFYRLVKN